MGFEPMNTGFADQRVSHFAIGAYGSSSVGESLFREQATASHHSGCAAVRR